ncbi:MAG TPA: flagellar basal body rod protein FlgB [Stellaceae bacterium]|nr:flagellar basal body rod protein FlgB [Stellaceae bacterium]
MIGSLDNGLEFYRQVLAVRGYRQEVLAADIANASTPGFKAVDVDFAQALQTATGGAGAPSTAPRAWLVSEAGQMPAGNTGASATAAAAGAVKYQTGTQVSLDGNSVDLDLEKTTAAANAVDYEAVATFTSQALKLLSIAINGSSAQGGGG